MTAAVAIDPRLRARRTAVLRAEGRRRLRILILTLAVMGGLVGAWAVSRSPLLDVDRVTISGVDAADAALVRQAAGVAEGEPLLGLDSTAIERAVSGLAWVAGARVHRDWPGTVSIEVVPRVPVAVVPSGGGLALLDADGYVIGPAPLGVDLPLIAVELDEEPGAVHTDAVGALAVVAALPDDLETWVTAIVNLASGGVGLELVGGASAIMGEPVRLDSKVTALRSVLFGVDLTCVSTIDVTMADLTTVTRDQLCLLPAG